MNPNYRTLLPPPKWVACVLFICLCFYASTVAMLQDQHAQDVARIHTLEERVNSNLDRFNNYRSQMDDVLSTHNSVLSYLIAHVSHPLVQGPIQSTRATVTCDVPCSAGTFTFTPHHGTVGEVLEASKMMAESQDWGSAVLKDETTGPGTSK